MRAYCGKVCYSKANPACHVYTTQYSTTSIPTVFHTHSVSVRFACRVFVTTSKVSFNTSLNRSRVTTRTAENDATYLQFRHILEKAWQKAAHSIQ